MKRFFFICSIIASLTFFSCDFLPSENLLYLATIPKETDRKWSILIYMSADNDLETDGLRDLCEMEMSLLDTDEVQVLVLLDRSSSYDYSLDNWSGTRLYELCTNKSSGEGSIISKQIECPVLGLNTLTDCELEMSSPYVLSQTLSFMLANYPSEKNALIMWGHGTGWRSSSSVEGISRAFAFDSTSSSCLSLKDLAKAIDEGTSGQKLDFIGFDTCFGGEVEVAYELRNLSLYVAGSACLILSEGWNYKGLFDSFSLCPEKSQLDLCDSVVSQFAQYYQNIDNTTISVSASLYIEELFQKFNDFCAEAATEITTTTVRDGIIRSLWNLTEGKFTHGGVDDDVYIDMNTLVDVVYNSILNHTASLDEAYTEFKSGLDKAVVESWANENMDVSLGVYFASISATGGIKSIFPSAYVKGKTSNQISFVTDADGYVPHNQVADSLMDKLFFSTDLES